MSKPILGILGGGQLGSMLAQAAKEISIETLCIVMKMSNKKIC